MKIDLNGLIEEVKALNASHAAIIDASAIKYSPEFREYCEQNRCGQYDTNWMCVLLTPDGASNRISITCDR